MLMDGRKSRYNGEVLEWYRGEDAGDFKRSELHELVENFTCLNALKGKIWKSDQKVVMDEKIVPKIVMDEESVQSDVMNEDFVQNGVMDGKFAKNFVMNAKIDPKVVMDLSIYSKLVDGTVCNPKIKICWRNLLMRMNRGC